MEEFRKKIDEIDEKLKTLFVERFSIVKEIGIYKLEHNLPIFDSGREKELIERNVKTIKDLCFRDLYGEFYEKMLELSKKLQERIINEEDEIH